MAGLASTTTAPLVYDLNFALAGFDRTHVFQMGFVYALPWLQDSQTSPARFSAAGRSTASSARSRARRIPIGGTNTR